MLSHSSLILDNLSHIVKIFALIVTLQLTDKPIEIKSSGQLRVFYPSVKPT